MPDKMQKKATEKDPWASGKKASILILYAADGACIIIDTGMSTIAGIRKPPTTTFFTFKNTAEKSILVTS